MSGWTNTAAPVIEAVTVIITTGTPSSGIFVYNGTPAFGNLIGSWTAAAGTDTFGNNFGAGVVTYNQTTDLFSQLQAGTLVVGELTGGAGSAPDTIHAGEIVSSGTSLTSMIGAHNVALPDAASFTLAAGVNGATTGNPGVPAITMVDSNDTSPMDLQISGSIVKCGTAGGTFTWQTPTYNSGWMSGPAGGTVQALQFRLDPMDNLYLTGSAHTFSATPNAVIFTLPAGYQPAVTQRVPCVQNNAGTITVHYLEINSSGAVSVNPNFAVSGNDLYVSTVVPLGHIG